MRFERGEHGPGWKIKYLMKTYMQCRFDGCGRREYRGGYCKTHYVNLKAGKQLQPIRDKIPRASECKFEGCDRPVHSKNLCSTHYQMLRHGKPLRPVGWKPPYNPPECSFDGCSRIAKSKGFCSAHYLQYKYGSELKPLQLTEDLGPRELADWILARTTTTDTGCMEWNGARNRKGYGLAAGGLAHRKVLEGYSSDPPQECCRHYVCGNPACCNPDHLKWGTHRENALDRERHGTGRRGVRVENRRPYGMNLQQLADWIILECEENEKSCLITPRARGENYGNIGYKGKSCGTHWIIATAYLGPALPGMLVRHLCGDPRCCNPNHLEWGSASDNQRDRRSPKDFVLKRFDRGALEWFQKPPHPDCKFPGCNRPGTSMDGYCKQHRHQIHTTGVAKPIRKQQTSEERGCDFPGCDRPHSGYGLCDSHLWQKKNGLVLRPIGWRPPVEKTQCSASGCERTAVAKGFCGRCYMRDKRARRKSRNIF